MAVMEDFGVEAPAFLGGAKGLLIGGRWQPAASGEDIAAINPATGEAIARIARGARPDVDAAVAAARTAFEGEWSRWTPHERRRLLIRVHDLVEKHFDELALIDTLDMGAPLARTRGMKGWLSQMILSYAAQTTAGGAETLQNSMAGNIHTMKLKAPVGVVGGIIPWNAPLMSQWWILGPTLATGCTAVLKPAEDASLSALRVAELLQEAGVPDGVINVVTGFGAEAGQALAEHPGVDRLAFTGSVDTARRIVAASAGNVKRLSLELGGKSPDIVFRRREPRAGGAGRGDGLLRQQRPDLRRRHPPLRAAGDPRGVRQAAERLQPRSAARERARPEGRPRAAHLAAPARPGDALRRDRLRRGARLASGGRRLEGALAKGFFVEPTVFADATNDMTIAREEIFGPVVTVIPFDTVEEALALANDTAFGLAGGVWTRSLSTAHRMARGIRAGTIWINGYGVLDPVVGFGGYRMSGYGWKGGKDHVESFLYPKAVYMNLDD